MTIKSGIAITDHGIVAVNSDRTMVVRNGKAEGLLVELFFSVYRTVKLNDPSHTKCHAVSILSICEVKRCRATLDFAGEKWKVHAEVGHKKRGIEDGADERPKSLELFGHECGALESDGIVRLRPGTLHWNALCPGFICTFNQDVEVLVTANCQVHYRRDK